MSNQRYPDPIPAASNAHYEHAVRAASQYDAQYRGMAVEILRLRHAKASRARAEGFVAGFGMRPAFKLEQMEDAWIEYAKSRGVDPVEEPLFEGAWGASVKSEKLVEP